MSKILDLREMTDAQRNNSITDAISEAVCGWKKFTIEGHGNYFRDQGGAIRSKAFATSADAVLPLLDKYCWTKTELGEVIIWNGITISGASGREKYPFSLAACFAILCANGYEVLT